jgi:hypothetical protein
LVLSAVIVSTVLGIRQLACTCQGKQPDGERRHDISKIKSHHKKLPSAHLSDLLYVAQLRMSDGVRNER